MTAAEKTIKFLNAIDRKTFNAIMDNIAKHYGIGRWDAFDEVTDPEAESLLDYVTGPERAATSLLMKRHGIAA